MILDIIKFYINKLHSPKYILKGKCKQCGNCCRNIIFYAYDTPIKDIETFNHFKKQNKHLRLFYNSGKNKSGELLFTCKSLNKNNLCKNYFFRSLYCRKYPLVKSLSTGTYLPTMENCGYEIIPNKSFNDFMKE